MAKSLKQSTKKAAYQAKLSQLDSLGEDLDDFIKKEGMTLVEQAVGDFVERIHENINKEKDFVTTGAINQIEVKGEAGVINVYANPHLIYQDRGVNGSKVKLYDTPHSYTDKKPPIDAFRRWIKSKQSFLTDKNDYHKKYDDRLSEAEKAKQRPFKELTDDEKITNAAWAMSTKVYQEGFKPRNIYSKQIPKLVDDLKEQLADFCVQQIAQQIEINPRQGGGNRIVIGF